jgi:primosomal replication protein N
VFSHTVHQEEFWRFPVEVERLSGTVDKINVLARRELLDELEPIGGGKLLITGQVRSFNNRTGVGNRLILTVYPLEITPATGEPCNRIILSGSICKPPIFRRTPLGRSICDLMLAVPRRYGRADYLPAIAWGQLAVHTGDLQVGDSLTIDGRVQSRIYHKATGAGVEERVAY